MYAIQHTQHQVHHTHAGTQHAHYMPVNRNELWTQSFAHAPRTHARINESQVQLSVSMLRRARMTAHIHARTLTHICIKCARSLVKRCELCGDTARARSSNAQPRHVYMDRSRRQHVIDVARLPRRRRRSRTSRARFHSVCTRDVRASVYFIVAARANTRASRVKENMEMILPCFRVVTARGSEASVIHSAMMDVCATCVLKHHKDDLLAQNAKFWENQL